MGRDFELLSELVKSSSEAALGTLEEKSSGASWPYISGTGYVVEDEARLSAAVFLSRLARHTRNLQKNPRVSLLIIETGTRAPIHERARATLIGQAELIRDEKVSGNLKKEYLKRFPKAEIFFSLPDFAFYRIEPVEIHWIGGFGKAGTFIFEQGQWQPRSS